MSFNAGSGANSRRGSSNCDTPTGEWTARTEVINDRIDPFGEHHDQSEEFEDQDPLISQNNIRTVIRKIGLKRNSQPVSLDTKVKLDRVLGLTVSNNASLDCDPYSGVVVYPSGCVLVLYNQRRNKQKHIINSLKKPITACKYSADGKYIVTGECGHQPQVRVWEVSSGEQLASLSGHKHGINCVAFSPDGKYVISVGSQHDMLVNVWDWRNSHVVATNKVSVKVKAMSFAEDGNCFVTVGNRHVKFWYLDYNHSSKNKFEPLPLMGRNAILGDQRNNYFCDVVCGRGDSKESTYAITKSGLLCEFNNRRLLNKWVELKTESANCVTISQQYVLVGCAQGVIRCFRPQTLEFVCTLPRPHFLGVDIAKGIVVRNELSNSIAKMNSNKPKHADTVAVVYDDVNKIVTAIYSDRSIYFWSLGDIKRIGKLNSFFYHSSCIWDIEMYPAPSQHVRPLLPPGTFLTCSSDDTIRIWNVEFDQNVNSSAAKMTNYIYRKNFFSPELLKILYMDPEMAFLCDHELVQSRNNNPNNNNGNSNAKEESSYDSKNGIRAIKFSTDGRHLASGDRSGNIRIFDLELQKDLYKIEAHDSEVLCLEYSNEILCGRKLLVSASRDRFIHIYDVHRQYSCIQNIDDHSSSITSVKFVCDKMNPRILQMISCGADKSLIFRKQTDPESDFRLEHQVAGKSTFYDMAVESKKNQIIIASQDRLVRSYDVKTAKNTNSFKGSLGEDGALIKIVFDPSATFIATSCTDKSIYIFDYQSGECLATTSGHSEIVTGLKFSHDGRHLISISGDGCIFVWRLPVEMTNAIASKLGLPLISDACHTTTIPNRNLTLPLQPDNLRNGSADAAQANINAYRFNTSTLPSWAKKQMFDDTVAGRDVKVANDENETYKTLPRGRWAQRVMEEPELVMNQGLVRSYANTFESLASRSTPSTPSGANSPTLKELKMTNRVSMLSLTPTRERVKSSLSSGMEDDDDDHNTTDSDNTNSHESSYKVTNVSNEKAKLSRGSYPQQFGMITSISMANINDLPYDEEEASGQTKVDSKNRYSSLYMSTENLEKIDQRNRYLKSVFENIDKNNFENNNSASDDSGINQIDHSLGSSITAAAPQASPQSPNGRQSLSSKVNKISSKTNYASDGASDDATTLSDITDQEPVEIPTSAGSESKFSSVLDTIRETPNREDNDSKSQTTLVASESANSTTSDETVKALSGVTITGPMTKVVAATVESSPGKPSVSKKREEMAKAIDDAKKKLESLDWKGSSLSISKSVANLREPEEKDDQQYLSLSNDAFRKSISLSDLSFSANTLPKRLSVYRTNNANSSMNNYQFAPLWDSRRVGPMPSANQGSLSRTPSSTTLNKVDMMRSQSTLCRQGLWPTGAPPPNGSPGGSQPQQLPPAPLLKPPNGLMNSGSASLMINPRSGRSSAPPSQFRKSTAATVSCASSRRGDSTEDDDMESAINSDDEQSDEHRIMRPRPVTPPKPNILKQIRRGSNPANQNTLNPNHYPNSHYIQHPPPVNGGQTLNRRRLWSADTMRSSKSEFNLANIGRETPVRRRNNSGLSPSVWNPNPALMVNDRLDLYQTNPSSIPLSLDLCQHLINEMNFLTTYASRIHERASYSDNSSIVDYLNETLGQVSRDIQSIVGRSKVMTTAQLNGNNNNTSATVATGNKMDISPNELEMFQNFLAYMKLSQKQKQEPTTSGGANGNSGEHPAQSNGNLNGQDHFSS